ncbi:hypothetical protein IWW55_003321, partial [Coemansia sp. RSA 2706]
MLANLSDDVILLVVAFCIDQRNADLKEWKKQLVYLKVCRKWRALALPLICRNMFVRVSS